MLKVGVAMVSQEALQHEEEQMRLLKWLADATVWRITVGPITRAEGEQIIEATREGVLALFPDKGDLFDLVLRPRFERLLGEHLEEEFWRKLRG
ncbi:MAG: hypothetical protein FVQ86_09500 [candidate division NC10 bacterium]|nr:hypothetical protein [candidate division NC10 bacterium]